MTYRATCLGRERYRLFFSPHRIRLRRRKALRRLVMKRAFLFTIDSPHPKGG